MNRDLLAGLLIAIVVAFLLGAVVSHWRYARYRRRWERGHRKDKPVRKPFWID